MATIPKGVPKAKGDLGEDMVVLYEDQQKINLFAKKNAQKNDIKEQIRENERILQNVEEASDEIMLLDDDQLVPYEIGETFVLLTVEETQQKLEKSKEELEGKLKVFRGQVEEIEELLKKVKVQLYAKFGDNINLEAPET